MMLVPKPPFSAEHIPPGDTRTATHRTVVLRGRNMILQCCPCPHFLHAAPAGVASGFGHRTYLCPPVGCTCCWPSTIRLVEQSSLFRAGFRSSHRHRMKTVVTNFSSAHHRGVSDDKHPPRQARGVLRGRQKGE